MPSRCVRVVPVAIDLGVVLLRRGQGMADPDARKAELERAEKTFLAVRGVAGETDEYRLFLGQVYYWLGKHADGRKLFDELLKAHNRNVTTLVGVGRLLREVGAVGEARALEEAYKSEANPEKKEDVAVQVALVTSDLDDKITWLNRAAGARTCALLSNSLGRRALRDGKDDEAAKHLRDAIGQYAKLPINADSLNNAALAWWRCTPSRARRRPSTRRVRCWRRPTPCCRRTASC
jgi:tetratricopeptide (TPR) repeat protein